MNTELFITTPRLGTVEVFGTLSIPSVTITGTGTNFKADDVGKAIIIRTTAGDKRDVIATYVSATSVTVTTGIDTTQSGCYFYVDYATMDLYDDFPYSLNYTIADIRNPESRNSSYSKTIKLPGTDANNIIFDNIFEVNLEGSFNPNIRAFVIVYQNYIPVFNGNLQLLKIYRDFDKIEYDVAIFGKIGDLFQKVADKLLTDLDLSDLDQTGTAAQITSSWATPTDLFYPYLDNGRQNISVATPAYVSDQIAPSILVSRVFEDILSSVGYSCADTATLYSETGMDKLYIPCLKQWRRRVYIKFGLRGSYSTLGNTGDVYLVITRVRTGTTESHFVGGMSDSVSSISYETTIELDYGDIVFFELQFTLGNGVGSFTEVDHADTYLQISYLDTEYNYNTNGYNNLDLTANIVIPGAGTSNVHIKFDNEISDVNNTWNTTTNQHTVPVKHTQGFLPDNYKQRDFLLALIKMFNLYLEPVFDNDTQINILPRDTYYSQGGVVDWTDKLDVGQPIEFTPMGELDWKEYLFSLKEDADFWNKDYKAKNFETYGQRTVIVENDFIATKKSIIPELAPFPLRQSAYNSLVLSNCIKDGVSTIPNIYLGILRVIYYDATAFNANQTPGATTLDGVAKTYYPFSGHLVGTPQVPTFDYNYAAPRSVYYTLNNPTLYPISNNLYTSFWQNFIEEISDKYSKLMVAYFNLTSEDIRTIDFRDSYFVDGTYYRLNKIMDYSPIGNTLTKVELIKIRDAVFIPSDSFSHGDVDLTTVGVGTPPYTSSTLSQGAVIVGDTSGLASESEAATTLGDLFVYSGSKLVRLPIGSNGKVLTVDTSDPTRSMSWTTPSGGGGTPGGANKQVQYNDSGAFGAEAGFEYDKTTNILSVDTVDIDKAILTDIATPTAPAANSLILFSKDQNGLSVPHILDENGNEIEITRDNLTIVRNTSGASISKGSVVYITGATGSVPNISKARANSLTTLPAYGIMYQTTANNGFGWMMIIGVLENFNLSAFAVGDLLYVSPTTAGILTATKPISPNFAQSIGVVLHNGVGNGVLQVFTRVVERITTQPQGTNDTTPASTAFVQTAVAGVSITGANLYLFYNLS